MSDTVTTAEHGLRRPMVPRDPEEEHRTATTLELFFDLCFVVAVAQAAAQLHHALNENHVAAGLLGYAMVFFAIWRAWMNFTWFASAYDCDDVPYRLATLLVIAGALILAAGVPRAFNEQDFAVVTLGYVVMRLALVGQWLRAARTDREHRTTALRYAGGVTAVQIGWVARLALPDSAGMAAFAVLVVAELAVPIWAESSGATTWHPHHIAERYGLFTIIVLGESVLASALAIQRAVDAGESSGELYAIVLGGLLIVFAMWWLYFAKPAHRLLDVTSPRAFLWGYGHLLIFASAAAVGAGIGVSVDHVTDHGHASDLVARGAVTVPVALYLLVVWAIHLAPHHAHDQRVLALPVLAALLVLATTGTGPAVLLTGLVLAALVAASLLMVARPVARRSGRRPRSLP
jgi:low temperature requirement protein LtrA